MKTFLIMLVAACCCSLAATAQLPYPAVPAPAGNIVRAEYFFDTDPGFGNATTITLTPAANISNFSTTITINGQGLIPGFHRLYIRTQDANGFWSQTNNIYFDNYVVPVYGTTPAIVNLQEAEYFIDTDPGIGNGIKIPIAATTDINNLNAIVDISALTKSVHWLYIRTRDIAGKWSITNRVQFDYSAQAPYPTAPPASVSLSFVEYFIDTDPGIGLATKVPLTPGTDISNHNITVNLNGLPPAAHWLYVRTVDANGKWSLTNMVMFENTAQTPYPVAAPPAPPIGTLEYFIDTDPGFGNGMPVTVPAQTDIAGLAIDIPVGGLAAGPHTLYIRSKQNPWSFAAYAEFSMGGMLPLTWSYVKGELHDGESLLTWGTAQESNTRDFVIEHSIDGIQYTTVGSLPAAGNSATPLTYRFIHGRPSKGVNYYRIRQRDLDGRSTLSKVIVLLNNSNQRETIIAPNPVAGIVHLIEPAAVTVKKAEVYDMKGRLVLTENFGNQLKQVISLNLQGINAGQYIIKVTYADRTQTFRIVKQ
jgi:hypothetical protein